MTETGIKKDREYTIETDTDDDELEVVGAVKSFRSVRRDETGSSFLRQLRQKANWHSTTPRRSYLDVLSPRVVGF